MNTALSTLRIYARGGAGIQADRKTIPVNGIPAIGLSLWLDTAGPSLAHHSRYLFPKI